MKDPGDKKSRQKAQKANPSGLAHVPFRGSSFRCFRPRKGIYWDVRCGAYTKGSKGWSCGRGLAGSSNGCVFFFGFQRKLKRKTALLGSTDKRHPKIFQTSLGHHPKRGYLFPQEARTHQAQLLIFSSKSNAITKPPSSHLHPLVHELQSLVVKAKKIGVCATTRFDKKHAEACSSGCRQLLLGQPKSKTLCFAATHFDGKEEEEKQP